MDNELDDAIAAFFNGLGEPPLLRLWSTPFALLSEPEQIFFVVFELETQVHNGGFVQFFGNDIGRFTSLASASYRAIGAEKAAAIVEQAVTVVGHHIDWNDDEARHVAIEALTEMQLAALGKLDEAFWIWPDDLSRLLYAFVQSHGHEFKTL